MDEGEFSGRRLYNGLRLDYRLIRLCAFTSALRAISAVAELLVFLLAFGEWRPVYFHRHIDCQCLRFSLTADIVCFPNV